jgi:hypothetical protein
MVTITAQNWGAQTEGQLQRNAKEVEPGVRNLEQGMVTKVAKKGVDVARMQRRSKP